MIDLTKNLAAVNRRAKSSVIRELLKLTNKPEIISFAGGLPDPAAFPREAVMEICAKVLRENAREALQYGETEGCPSLKAELVRNLREDEGLVVRPENILITTASQQSLDLAAKLFIDASDPIIVELPSYAGALQVFKSYGGLMVGVKSDDDGMRMDDLEVKLEKLKKEGEHYKFIYIIPDFQNPSGITLSQERREQMVRLSREYDVIILEDSPYRKIRFEGRSPDMLYKLDTSGNVISLFTFSKTFAPGFRLGYIVGNEAIIKRMAILKQSMDLCSSPFAQLVAAEFLRGGYYQEHVKKVVRIYKAKKDHMLAALARHMPEGVTWTKPEGGLFLWLRLPETMDGDDLFSEALKENVAYVVGSAFHCDGAGRNTMRLNFSYSTPEKIDEGIKRLATVFKKNWKK
ncbi:MAG: PLP-dependent aminotransferase family protein [Elusimicrobiales bacterium]|nr:PLP-dependent aminotransferase family protein [Elusimicrobiales bacterium]